MKKLLLILLIFSCQSQQLQEQQEILAPATPESQGVSSQAILDFIQAAEAEQPDALHSFIFVRHGRNIAQGWWDPYNPDSPHLLYSLSKSFTSTAIGLAVSEGLVSLHDPVISFFPEQTPEEPSENLQQMRIIDLLRMTTGHATDSYGRIQGHPDGWVTGFLSLPVEHKPGTIFIYNTGATYMLSAILQKVTGETLIQFLQPRLFEPLDIDTPFWQSDPEGINLGGTGLFVKTMDIAKFGQMLLQKGSWNGRQIVPVDWVEMATSLQTSNGSNPNSDWGQGYGFQFWQCRNNAYRGDGAFGQYCIVIPKEDAVLAITSGSGDMQGILNLVWAHLLPALQEQALPENPEAHRLLVAKTQDLIMTPVEGSPESGISASVSGKRYEITENAMDFEAIQFDLNSDEKTILMWSGDHELQIPLGYGDWENGEMNIQRLGVVPVAASGAWTDENTFRLTAYNYESPHAVTYDFHFEDNELMIDSEVNVAFGPTARQQMQGQKLETEEVIE